MLIIDHLMMLISVGWVIMIPWLAYNNVFFLNVLFSNFLTFNTGYSYVQHIFCIKPLNTRFCISINTIFKIMRVRVELSRFV